MDVSVSPGEQDALRAAIAEERRRGGEQIDALQRGFNDIVEAAELTSTDDEHDPEGATIAYERAQVWSLLRQARDRKSTRLNSSHLRLSRMPSSA